MVQYKLINPARANVYFDTAGTARQVGAGPLGSGVAKGLFSDRSGMGTSNHGIRTAITVGSLVPSGLSRTEAASTAHTFAAMTEEEYIIRRVTDTIGGSVANTTLRSGGSSYAPKRSIHRVMTGMRHRAEATAIRDGYWNEFSGVFSTAPTATNNSIFDASGNSLTDGSADDEANATREQQGEFAYRDHSPTVVFGQYSPRTG